MLHEHHRSTLYNAVQSVLSDVALNVQSSLQVEEAIQAAISAVQAACVDFAQAWNNRHSQCITRQLPVEILTACLRAADFDTRVRASHVSHIWRTIALADPYLWASFSSGEFTERIQQDTAFERLAIMLQRSRPAPFQLKLSHAYRGDEDDYAVRLRTLLHSDLQRLQVYEGPRHVFCRINPRQLVLEELISVNCMGPTFPEDAFNSSHQLAEHCLPNLRSLSGIFVFTHSSQYRSLQHLACLLPIHSEADYLFRVCPRLLTVDLHLVTYTTRLPLAPLPASLLKVTLRGDRNGMYVELLELEKSWPLERIPHMVLLNASPLSALIPMFLSTHDGPLGMIISDGSPDVILTTELTSDSQFRWEIGTLNFWDATNPCNVFKKLCGERLTSLSLSIAHIWTFLKAQLHAPLLVSLEISLAAWPEWLDDSTQTRMPDFFLQAPHLRRFVLSLPDLFDGVSSYVDELTDMLELLAREFRALFVYDADLLDFITLRGSTDNFAAVKCPNFSHYAREYVVDGDGAAL